MALRMTQWSRLTRFYGHMRSIPSRYRTHRACMNVVWNRSRFLHVNNVRLMNDNDDLSEFQHLLRGSEIELPTLRRMHRQFTKLIKSEPGSNLSKDNFKKLLLNYAASHLDDDSDVDRFFKLFDSDGDGSVSFEEFVTGIALLRADLSVAEQRADVANFLFDVLDKDGNGVLEHTEVIAFVRAQLGPYMMSRRFDPNAVQTAVENIYRSLGWDVEHSISKSEFARLVDSYWDSHLVASHAGV